MAGFLRSAIAGAAQKAGDLHVHHHDRMHNDVDDVEQQQQGTKVTSDTNGRVTATDPVNTAVSDLQPESKRASNHRLYLSAMSRTRTCCPGRKTTKQASPTG